MFAVVAALAVASRAASFTPVRDYEPSSLLGDMTFNFRNAYLMDETPVKDLVTDTVCFVDGFVCEDFFDSLWPQFKMLVTFEAEGATEEGPGIGNADGDFEADAAMVLLSTPGDISLFNSIVDALAGPVLVPSVYMSYWGASLQYTGERDTRNLAVEAQDTAAGTAFYDLIEYEDTNEDGSFTPGTDAVLQTIELSQMAWNAMQMEEVEVEGEIGAWVFTADCDLTSEASEETGTFGIRFAAANAAVVDENGALITPKSTKIDIEINNFPFSGENSFIAVRTTVGSAAGQFDLIASRTGTFVNMKTADGLETYYDWKEDVSYDGRTVSVRNSGFVQISGEDNLSLGAKALLQRDESAVAETYFSFQGETPNPAEIKWDPSVGFGAHPEFVPNTDVSPAGRAAPTLVAVLLAALLAVLF